MQVCSDFVQIHQWKAYSLVARYNIASIFIYKSSNAISQ